MHARTEHDDLVAWLLSLKENKLETKVYELKDGS
jgi:hypothetical protein